MALPFIYAAQLFQQADTEVGPLADQFRRGEFASLLEWLAEKIHRPGQCYSSAELVRNATGRDVDASALIGYLRGKYRELYGIA